MEEDNVKRRSQEQEMPKDKEAKRKRRQRKAAEPTSVSRDSDDIRKKMSGEKSASSLWLQSCRQEGLSRFRNVRSKPDQEKVAASDKDVESKKCQGQTLPRDHGGDSRASQGVRRCSYRLSFVFIGSSLSRNFRHPACPGSTCILSGLPSCILFGVLFGIYFCIFFGILSGTCSGPGMPHSIRNSR